jgi:hypothetical protein
MKAFTSLAWRLRSISMLRPREFFVAIAVCGLLSQGSWAAGNETIKAPSKDHAQKNRLIIKHQAQKSPSEESSAKRDRRLLRECKGRPNAGACLGYARP